MRMARPLRRLLALALLATFPGVGAAMPLLADAAPLHHAEHGHHQGHHSGQHPGDCCDLCIAACAVCSLPDAAAAPVAAYTPASPPAPIAPAAAPLRAPRDHRLPFPIGPPTLRA